jgi:hypothetical protein
MILLLEKAKTGLKTAYQKDYIKTLFVFLLFFACFSLIYFSLDKFISLDDPFFHIRFVEIFRQNGMGAFSDFHWLYFSKISDHQSYFIYYNFLFYLALIPFALIKPLFLGMKLCGVTFAALSFTGLYYFLLKIKEKNAFFWTMFLFGIINYSIIARFLTVRPFVLAPVLLILLLYFLTQKKYWLIFALTVVYFFWHTATFFFPLFVAVIYAGFENFYGKKPDWKPVIFSFAGIAVSFVATLFFAPGLFVFMKDIIFGVLFDTITGTGAKLAEGAELYSANVFDFFKSSVFIIALLSVAASFEVIYYIERKRRGEIVDENIAFNQILRSTLFFLSIFFLLGTFLTKRNGDFFAFFSATYIVVTFGAFARSIDFKFFLMKKAIGYGLVIVTIFFSLGNFLFIHDQIASNNDYKAIQGAAEWLKNNTERGEVVFNSTWNWFTLLFFYNTHNNYIAGIEPRFLYDYSPVLYWKWWHISNDGFLCEQENCDALKYNKKRNFRNEEKKKEWIKVEGNKIAGSILADFKSKYVITSKDFINLNEIMNNSDRFEKVYTDDIYNYHFVYKVK